MIQTNKQNLPAVFIREENHEPQPHRYSVTELLLPVQEILLTRKYYDKLETDVADSIPALFGTAVHKILEENSNPEESEVKIEVQFGEDTVVGIMDNVKNDEITDYKTCSVSKVMKKDFAENEMQIKMYSLMRFKRDGILTRKGTLYYLMKDWSKIKAAAGGNYPQSPIYVHRIEIQDSDYDEAEKYIKNKLNRLNSGIIINCTEEECWYTGTKYAVYKKAGSKRADYITDDEQDAHNFITNQCGGAAEIQVRKGEYLKCQYYCSCSKFCEQYRKEEE